MALRDNLAIILLFSNRYGIGETITRNVYICIIHICKFVSTFCKQLPEIRAKSRQIGSKNASIEYSFLYFCGKIAFCACRRWNFISQTPFRHKRIKLDCCDKTVVFGYRNCPACETHLCACLQSASLLLACKARRRPMFENTTAAHCANISNTKEKRAAKTISLRRVYSIAILGFTAACGDIPQVRPP